MATGYCQWQTSAENKARSIWNKLHTHEAQVKRLHFSLKNSQPTERHQQPEMKRQKKR
jgi:hypothetical protein